MFVYDLFLFFLSWATLWEKTRISSSVHSRGGLVLIFIFLLNANTLLEDNAANTARANLHTYLLHAPMYKLTLNVMFMRYVPDEQIILCKLCSQSWRYDMGIPDMHNIMITFIPALNKEGKTSQRDDSYWIICRRWWRQRKRYYLQ